MRRSGNTLEPVLPEYRINVFISQAMGLLAFSEVTTQDSGIYVCMVTVHNLDIDYSIDGGDSFKSPDYPLNVDESNEPRQEPRIQDSFPAVWPKNPIQGRLVRLECFAAGSTRSGPLVYSWRRRDGLPIPPAALKDSNRVIEFPSVQLEHQGDYECSRKKVDHDYYINVHFGLVLTLLSMSAAEGDEGGRVYTEEAGSIARQNDDLGIVRDAEGRKAMPKWLELLINTLPAFVAKPRDQVVDSGISVRFDCEAFGKPQPVHIWFRNEESVLDLLTAGKLDAARYTLVDSSISPATLKISQVSPNCNVFSSCLLQFRHKNQY
ncbi:unnamed protein product [Protopolystoma xenopodis]|uniref:Ig-like domain-containing protein n=1 Tax=Protopolystoma xenopodis TaxID=117903 RepID=A0A3S5A5U8_9PLAT|nr:unnamed protein product [Protopolystoma xenopodis]